MKKKLSIITALLFVAGFGFAQWSLKLTSNVYLRTWKLDTKASKEEKEIGGATITLFQGTKQIAQTTSNSDGEFTIMVPQNGEFYLSVSYPGCNTKRMAVNTQNVPEKFSGDNFKPTFEITGGFIMVKPYPGIDYSGLNNDLIRVEFLPNKKAFDDTEEGTEKGLGIVSKIYAAEDDLFNRFCSTNKAGDVALAKPDCPLAKSLYEKAIAMIPGEQYPVVQLAKVGLCLKDKELAEKKAAEEAAAKAAATNAKKEDADKKAIADAIAKANEEKAKQLKEEEEKLAKANKARAEKEEAENAKLAKQKAAQEKAKTKETKTATQTTTQTPTAQQTPTEKKDAIKIKQKSPEQIEKEAKEAKQREGMAKSKAEDEAAMKADADKAKAKYEEKQKADREKAEKQKEGLAKSKAEDEAAMKEKEAKKAAKQKEHEEKQKEGMAKSKAEDDAAMKADAEKREAKRKKREAEEEEKKKSYKTKTSDDDGGQPKGNSDNKIPQVIGAAEKYRERIKAADELFKRKRYDEAKDIYNEALMYKEKDPYATNKLAEIEKLKAPK